MKNVLWINLYIIFNLIKETFLVGTVSAVGKEPIYCSIANRNQFADYRFTFSLKNDRGYIEVKFPSQYRELLGIPLNPKCNVRCERGKDWAKFYFDSGLASRTDTMVEIKRVINPEFKGGVGNFEVRSKKGENTLDENLIFGSIGMGDNPRELTSTKLVPHSVGGSLNAGDLSTYRIEFKTWTFIPQTSYFRITPPLGEGYSVVDNPPCSFVEMDGYTVQGTLACVKKDDDRIYVRGLEQDIPIGTIMAITIEVTNPKHAEQPDGWRIEILRELTQFVYEWKEELFGEPIAPGKLSGITFAPMDSSISIAKGKRVLMRLEFSIKNPIPDGGIITISFPGSFTLVDNKFLGIPSTYFVISGLQNKDSANPFVLDFDDIKNILTIRSFQALPAGSSVAIALSLKLPNAEGDSRALTITTYLSEVEEDGQEGDKIDEDSTEAFVTIPAISSAIQNSYILTNEIASGVGTTDITLNFQLSIPVPANSFFEIVFESDLTLQGTAVCRKWNSATIAMMSAPCTISGQKLTLDFGTNTYALGESIQVDINGAMNLPTVAKEYILDARITDGSAILETYTEAITLKPTALTAMNFQSLPREIDTQVIVQVDFTVPFDVPISDGISSPVSELRLYVEGIGSTFIPKDLGYGSNNLAREVSCQGVSNIAPVVGNKITCIVFPGLNPYILVKNYRAITAGTSVGIEFADFKNPNGDYRIKISVLKIENGLYQEISSGTSSISTVPEVTLTADGAGITDHELQYTVDTRKVSNQFRLVFELGLTADLNSNDYLILKLPFYESGFIDNPNDISCLINGIVLACTPYKGVDWFKIPMSAVVASSNQNFLEIQNLKWPRYSKINDIVSIVVVDNSKDSIKLYHYAPLTPAESNLFEKYLLDIDKTRRGETNAKYTFTFQTKNGIADGGMISINLPVEYTLLASNPPIQIETPDFTPATGTEIQKFYSSASVSIENIGQYPALTDFRIILKGVRNPDTSKVLHEWSVSSLLEDKLVDFSDRFAAFSLDPTYIPRTITVNRITAIPDNAMIKASYYFSFTPRSSLGSGAEIHIRFPSQYKILPSEPYCIVWGALDTFSSCITNLNSIILTTDTEFTSGTINVKINNIRNPEQGTTDFFEIETQYDGQVVDAIDEKVLVSNTLQIKVTPPEIYVGEFNYDPQNEGEISTYMFSFVPTIKLEDGMEIIIIFPDTFDIRIGDQVVCYPIQNLVGDVKCRFDEKMIYIHNFEPVLATKDSPIKINIRGVVNPNRLVNSDSGGVAVGVIYKGSSTLLNFIAEAGVIETKPAAGWTLFHFISPTNYFSRFYSDYTLNITVFSEIPSDNSGGILVVDFPLDFESVDQNVTCRSLNETYGTPKCELISSRLYITGNEQPYKGNLIIILEKFKNPLEELTTGYFYVKTYDGYRKNIIERSFYNLDPFFNTYTYPGPVIKIDGDETIYVEAGTQTVDLYAVASDLSNLNLIFKPSTPSGMSFVPFELNMNIGENRAKFRISVSENMAEGTYLVNWEILNDLIPPYYTPIRPTKVVVTKNRGVPISIRPLTGVPFDGHSLPCRAIIENAPDAGLELRVALKFDYKGISLNKDILYFDSGDNIQTFEVYFTDAKAAAEENLANGQVEVTLAGANSKVYILEDITLNFNIEEEDVTPPSIKNIEITSISQHSCSIKIETNDLAMLYYMLAFSGTAKPSLFEVKNQGPPQHLSSNSRYGYTILDDQNMVEVQITGLSAETEYVFYVYAEDRGGNYNGEPGYLFFQTSTKFRAAEVPLKFNTNFLTGPQKELIRRSIAFKLSLPFEKVLEKTIDPQVTSLRTRNLQSVTEITVQVVPVNDNPNYPSPQDLAAKINEAETKAYLKGKVSSYDDTYVSPISTYPVYKPFFFGSPEIFSTTHDTITLDVGLTNYGIVLVVALLKEEDTLIQPSPWQIWKGLNAENVEVKSAKFNVYKPNKMFKLTMRDLTPNSTYEVYMIGGSFHPDFPDLMQDGNIIILETDTLEAPNLDLGNLSSIPYTTFVFLGFVLLNLIFVD